MKAPMNVLLSCRGWKGGGLEQWVSSSPEGRIDRPRFGSLLQIAAADFHAPLEGGGVCRRFPSSEGIHWYLE